jgi:hypothetical protein
LQSQELNAKPIKDFANAISFDGKTFKRKIKQTGTRRGGERKMQKALLLHRRFKFYFPRLVKLLSIARRETGTVSN